jgi:flavin-binding protein dodecin
MANAGQPEHPIYKLTTLVGTSGIGYEDALQRAIARAQKTLRHVQWFEVQEQRGRITPAGIEYQVTLKVGFMLDEPD